MKHDICFGFHDLTCDDLVYAVYTNDLVAVNACLERQCDPNEKDSDGNSALGWSIINSDLEITKVLLEAGADVNYVSSFGAPVFMAASRCDAHRLRLLLSYNPILVFKDGESALHSAVRSNCLEAAKILLEAKVEVNQFNSQGYCPIHLATKELNVDMVKLLVSYKADLSKLTTGGTSAHRMAVDELYTRGRSRYELIQLFKGYGAPCVPELSLTEKVKLLFGR